MDVKETLINECLNILHRKEVKDEFKELMRPLIDMLIKEIYPNGEQASWLKKKNQLRQPACPLNHNCECSPYCPKSPVIRLPQQAAVYCPQMLNKFYDFHVKTV